MPGADVLSTVLGDTEKLAALTLMASQYGPFFFSLLFVLFVPFLGQSWFSRILQSRIKKGGERTAALKVYKFYWLSGVVTGLILVAASVAWWGYVQFSYVLPDQDAEFAKRLSSEIEKRIFEGTITNVMERDVFIPDPTNRAYRLYVYPAVNETPMVERFVIIFYNDPPKDQVVQFNYIDKATLDALSENKDQGGFAPIEMPFCLSKHVEKISLVRHADSPPHFNIPCEGGQN